MFLRAIKSTPALLQLAGADHAPDTDVVADSDALHLSAHTGDDADLRTGGVCAIEGGGRTNGNERGRATTLTSSCPAGGGEWRSRRGCESQWPAIAQLSKAHVPAVGPLWDHCPVLATDPATHKEFSPGTRGYVVGPHSERIWWRSLRETQYIA